LKTVRTSKALSKSTRVPRRNRTVAHFQSRPRLPRPRRQARRRSSLFQSGLSDGAVRYRAVFVFDFITRQLPRLYISQLDKLTIQGIFVPFLQQCGGCLMGRFERRARHSGRSCPVPCVLLAGLFAFLVGCGGGGQADVQPPPPPPAPDFSLAFAPATVT